MISEMMVLAGRVIAKFSIENNIPMPYLSQASGKFSDEIIENINNLTLSKMFEAAKGFGRSKLSVKPATSQLSSNLSSNYQEAFQKLFSNFSVVN